jgi:isopentenyl diphosphate isomerase/L-lactate dehydrogenase-like FMN-dependent dehydrogenase
MNLFGKKNISTGGISRREFVMSATAIGAAAAVANPLMARAEESAVLAADAPESVHGAAPAAGLKMNDVLRLAREKLYPYCRVCPECDGVACAGEVPGFGGIGTASSFKNNYQVLAKLHLRMRTLHDVHNPDLSVEIFGQTISLPMMSAATGGTTYNMGGKIGEEEFVDAIVGGCQQAGTIGWVADGIGDPMSVFERRMSVVKNYPGRVIVTIKPKSQEEIIKRIALIEQAGGIAFGVDLDSAGRAARAVPGQIVEPKTRKQIEELVKSTRLPFIAKGIMTVEEAQIAVEAGARGIVVSNHGGRVLDHTPGVAEVLPEIAAKLKGKVLILADGAVRHGADVLKLVALGADATLCGRPLVRGAHGGGKDGVALMINYIKSELTDSMVLTAVASARKVSRSILEVRA